MKAIIPAAGYATRLYPLTLNTPKSLLEVGGRPMVEYVVEKIAELSEVDTIYIVTNAKFYQNFVGWLAGYKSPLPIEILNDGTTSNEDRLGCIGDLRFTIKEKGIDEDLVIVNGDSMFKYSLKEMFEDFKERNAATVCLVDVKDKEVAKRYGVVKVDEDNRVTWFEEKPEDPPSTLCSVACYMYPKEVVKMFDVYVEKGNNPDAPGKYVEWLHKEVPVYGHVYEGEDFYDIGSKDTLEEARMIWSEGK